MTTTSHTRTYTMGSTQDLDQPLETQCQQPQPSTQEQCHYEQQQEQDHYKQQQEQDHHKQPQDTIPEMDLAHEVVRLLPYSSRGSMSPMDLRTIYNMMPLQLPLHTVEAHSKLVAYLQGLDLNSEPIHTIGPMGWAIATSCPTCIFLCEQNGACPQKGRYDYQRLQHL